MNRRLVAFVAYGGGISVHVGVAERFVVQRSLQPTSGRGHERTTVLVAVRETDRVVAGGVSVSNSMRSPGCDACHSALSAIEGSRTALTRWNAVQE